MKKTLLTLLFAFATLCGFAQKKIWGDVVVGYRPTTVFNVNKVWFYPDRTDMLLHIDFIAGRQARIALGTTLNDGVNSYTLKGNNSGEYDGALCVEYDVPFVVPTSGKVDILLSFDPLPVGTKHFTLNGCDGWAVHNIRSAADLPAGITDTYWRNEATGDWLIGFAHKHVIYDSRFWDIKSMAEKSGSYTLTVENGDDVLDIKVGKMKKGTRTITVGSSKAVKCSPITTAALPDYPTKDTRVGFKDNGYSLGDSITIIGWLKDMPVEALERGGNEFEVSIENIISGDEENFYARLDSIGRFAIKVPLMNSTEAYLDWRRSKANVLLEPGETYLFLNDFTTGQQLFMGKDVRLQNELLAYPFKWFSTPNLKEGASDEEAMMYLAEIESELENLCDGLMEYTNEHPNLSRRCVDFVKGYYLTGLGRELMQGKFYVKDRLPAEYFAFVRDSLWCKEWQKPYTLYRDFSGLLIDYFHYGVETEYTGGKSFVPLLKGLADRGVITLNEREYAAVESYDTEVENVRAKINSLETEEEKKALAAKFNTGELVTTVSALLERYNEKIGMELYCDVPLRLADSITDNACLRDICVAYCMYRYIEDYSKPLNDAMVAFLQQNITLPAAKEKVMDMHKKYLAIMNREISSDANLVSSTEVADMSDGEKILRKLIEPYKGKIILIDVWGTWCGPCKRALSHSKELYERMAQYDIVFLYLANRSDDESWKNVIKEYEVTGKNVVHYNLPALQQSSVENFLKVNGYPTYRIVDKEGNILDINADPRNLNALENLIKHISK